MERKSMLLANLLLTATVVIGRAGPEFVNGENDSANCVRWPINGRVSQRLTPSHPTGIDIEPYKDQHAPINAPVDGKIVYIHQDSSREKNSIEKALGNYIVMDSIDGEYQFLFAHLSKIEVGVNQQVKVGEEIGLTGSTGNSTGPHVHFEVKGYQGIVTENPLKVLCKR